MEHPLLADFVQRWFDDLSRHVPVEHLLPRLSDTDLEMRFPERTLRSHADFEDWYAQVGRAYTDQTHTVEALAVQPDGDMANCAVTVVWEATSTKDGSRSAFRVHQAWRLRDVAPESTRAPRIQTYLVLDLNPIDVTESAGVRTAARTGSPGTRAE